MKNVIITGATGGIGKVICKRIAENGYVPIIIYNNNKLKAEEISSEISNSYVYKCDISNAIRVKKTAKNIENDIGDIYGIINNAGIRHNNYKITEFPDNEWDKILKTNISGAFYCAKYFSSFIKLKGRIINISSIAANIGILGQLAYSTSKSAFSGFTKTLAVELAPNITVNTICPGPIDIDHSHFSDQLKQIRIKMHQNMKKKIPLKRLGKPEDITSLILYLLNEKNDYITGQTITIDGGLTLL